MKDVVIASACRTPIGKFQGGLSGFRAPELGAFAVREALRRAGVAPDMARRIREDQPDAIVLAFSAKLEAPTRYKKRKPKFKRRR